MKRSNAIRRAPVFFLALGALAVAPSIAQAQRRPRPQQAPPAEDPRVVEARRAYDDGRRLFDARSYPEALRRFERAFELRNNPVILVAIANCHEQTGNFRDAVGALERYLRDRADASDRAQIEQRLAQLRPRAAAQTTATNATSTATATTTSNANSAATTGAGAATAAGRDAGSTASASGANTATTATTASANAVNTATTGTTGTTGANGATDPTASGVSASTGSQDNVADANTAGAAIAPVEPVAPPPARGVSPAVWVCAGLAAAGVAGGSVLGFLALGDHATYNTAPTRELKDRGETYALLADLSFATAVLSGFVGTVVFLSDRAEAEREQRASQALRPHERSRRASRTRVLPAPTGLTVHF